MQKREGECPLFFVLLCDNITEAAGKIGYTVIKQNRKELPTMAAMNINNEKYQELLHSSKPLLVDFWAPWCSYCRRIGPAYDRIAQQFEEEIHVVKINIDDEAALAASEHIEVIPTLVLYRDGQAIGSIVAPESKAMIEGFIRESLEK